MTMAGPCPVVRPTIETILNNGSVSWSPDGKRLAGIGQPGTKAGYIWIIDPAFGRRPSGSWLICLRTRCCAVRRWTRDGASLVIGQVRSTGDIILAERLR